MKVAPEYGCSGMVGIIVRVRGYGRRLHGWYDAVAMFGGGSLCGNSPDDETWMNVGADCQSPTLVHSMVFRVPCLGAWMWAMALTRAMLAPLLVCVSQ